MVVMLGFVASRLLGLVRNMVITSQFGAGREYEIFLAAIAVPDLIFQVLAGGAVGSAFIPVFNAYLARGEEAAAWRLTNAVMTLAALATTPIAVLIGLVAHPLVDFVIVPGWDPASKSQTAELMRLMLLSPVIFAVSGFATSVLSSFQRFAWAALAPIAYNLSIIAAAMLARPLSLGVEALGYGVNSGALLHLLVQLPACRAQGMPLRAVIDFQLAGVREVGRLMVPRMLGLAVVQLNQLVNIVLASFLVVGSIVYLNVAWLLLMSPLVLAMSVSTAVFPTLASDSALERRGEVRRLFLHSFRSIVFLTVPASIGLIVLGEPLIRLLFERGEFTAEATRATAFALRFYALGLLGHAAVEIVDRVFYAFHDTWSPVRVALGAIAANLTLSLLLMNTALGYGGLALANALAACGEGLMLFWLLSRRLESLDAAGLGLAEVAAALTRVLAAALVMALVISALSQPLLQQAQTANVLQQALALILCAAVGVAVYLATAFGLGVKEARALPSLIPWR
jgi:putative peptidoglycan lipid II flippase